MRDEELEATGIAKFVPLIVMFGAVTGFVALAWYAYHAGRQSMKEEDLLVIEAEKSPVKEKPTDPGGMKFPNQDKTIFETFSSSHQQPQAKVERVLPSPEEPISKAEAIEAMTNKRAEKAAVPLKDEKITFDDITPAVTMKAPEEDVVMEEKPVVVKEQKVAEKPVAKPVEKAIEKVVEKPVQKIEEKKPVKVDRKNYAVNVQLGAYASESEAQENWKKLQSKFSALNGRSPILARADVKGKTFIRLRVGVADKADGKSLCGALSAKGQACIIASE